MKGFENIRGKSRREQMVLSKRMLLASKILTKMRKKMTEMS